MTHPAILILIIGTSSSGKTTFARKLQAGLGGYWQYMGLDSTFAGVPPAYGGGHEGVLNREGFHYQDKATNARIVFGPIGERVLHGMIQGAVAMVNAGVPVLFDDMLLNERHAAMWRAVLQEVPHLVIRLTAADATLQVRNQSRANPPNLSLNHIAANTLLQADFTFDTSHGDPAADIDRVRERISALRKQQG
ncbi:MAG: hypothetical protein OHK0029_33090 [Armatimonadaceae bacterium]